jgi:hypothetical protein
MEPRITRIARSLALLALFTAPATVAQQKVYRWVDENGEVHYTQSLPPDFKDKGHDVLDKDGLVRDEGVSMTPEHKPPEAKEQAEDGRPELPRDSSGLPRPKPLYSAEETQQRMDSFLMLRYRSEDEIGEAMNVEIKQLEYDRRLLQTSRDSLNDAYRGQIRIAGNKQRAGLDVGDDDSKAIRQLQSRLRENQVELDRLMVREENIRADFQVQLDRYRYLVEQYSDKTGG